MSDKLVTANTLTYKGTILNNLLWNGQCNNFKIDNMLFTGKYQNGKRNGQWIVRDLNHKIIFEGLIKDNIYFDGILTEYSNKGTTFTGNIKNGKKSGHLSIVSHNGIVMFSGDIVDGKIVNGICTGFRLTINGNVYMVTGEIKDGQLSTDSDALGLDSNGNITTQIHVRTSCINLCHQQVCYKI